MDRKDYAAEVVKAGSPNSALAALTLVGASVGYVVLLSFAVDWLDQRGGWLQALLTLPFVALVLAGILAVWLLYGAAMDLHEKP